MIHLANYSYFSYCSLSSFIKKFEFEKIRRNEIELESKALQNRIGRVKQAVDLNKWNIEYEKRRYVGPYLKEVLF
jgi:hypothetical protein